MTDADEVDQQVAGGSAARIDQKPDFEPPANPEWDMDWWERLWAWLTRKRR